VSLKLTGETYDAFKQEIPWGEIPATLQDSITFCRGLGIQYIWIDALCIIQHDVEDWKRESAQMAEVYRNGLVCLAAADSEDTTAGCLWERGPAFQGLQIQGNHTLYPECSYDSFLHAGLDTRAWCLQEKLLSRRTIYLSKGGAWMECLTDVVSEGFPVHMPNSVHSKQSSPLKRAMINPKAFASERYEYEDAQMQLFRTACAMITPKTFASGRDESENGQLQTFRTACAIKQVDRKGLPLLLQLWGRVTADYATRQLTRWSDRLIAFHAILSSLTECKFLGSHAFGHWERLLPWDLLWVCPVSEKPRRRLQEKDIRLPSWSWLSVSGLISLTTLGFINELATRQPSANEFVASCPDFLRTSAVGLCLSTRVREICLVKHLSREFPLQGEDAGFVAESRLTLADALFTNQRLGVFVYEDPDWEADFKIDVDARLYAALVWHSDIELTTDSSGLFCCGLLLRKTRMGSFRRVGAFSVEGQERMLPFLRHWKESELQTIQVA